MTWLANFSIILRRLKNSWNEMIPYPSLMDDPGAQLSDQDHMSARQHPLFQAYGQGQMNIMQANWDAFTPAQRPGPRPEAFDRAQTEGLLRLWANMRNM